MHRLFYILLIPFLLSVALVGYPKEPEVWECPTCNDLRVCRYSKLFSRYKKCPACNTKSLMSESETIRYATTRRSGLKRIHNTCKYCGHEFSFDRIIPQKTESSSSSSSSSGFSSGGGSSSGGGASGGW